MWLRLLFTETIHALSNWTDHKKLRDEMLINPQQMSLHINLTFRPYVKLLYYSINIRLMEEFSGNAFSYWLLAFGTWLLTNSQKPTANSHQ